MSDFMKEIKLSKPAYRCWVKIKDMIQQEMLEGNDKHIVCVFEAPSLSEEVINFLKEQEFDVISGDEIWDKFPADYLKSEIMQYCRYELNYTSEKYEYIERESPYIPCVIKW